MKTIDDILNYLTEKHPSVMIVRPATDKDIQMCNEDFIEWGMNLKLPDEYVNFLKQLNGFAWNGIELYSTDRVTDTETGYMLNDIVSANEDFHDNYDEYERFKKYLCFGRVDDDMYIYNTTKENKRWEVLDIVGLNVMEEYDSFEEFFVAVVGGYI